MNISVEVGFEGLNSEHGFVDGDACAHVVHGRH